MNPKRNILIIFLVIFAAIDCKSLTNNNVKTPQTTSTGAVLSTYQLEIIETAATQKETATPTKEEPLLGKNVIAIEDWANNTLYLLDIDTGVLRLLNQNEVEFGSFSWINDGCEIIVNSIELGIIAVNLEGTITKELIPNEGSFSEKDIFEISLSPDETWLAYLVDTEIGLETVGGFDYSTVSGYVEVVQINDPQEIYRISDNAGSTEIVWSPDGALLAFNDIDSEGIHQLFVSTPDGEERKQLTHFDEKHNLFRYISWSPDGKSLAFNQTNMETYAEDFVVVSLSGKIKTLDLSDQVTHTDSIMWQDNSLILVYGTYDDPTNSSYDNAFWVEVETGSVVDVMFPDHSIDSFSYPVPIGSTNKLGFFVWGDNIGFYTYDVPTKSIILHENVNVPFIWHFITGAPEGFQGEAACLP